MSKNYEDEITKEKVNAVKYIYLFKLALEQMTLKNPRQEKNLDKLYRSLTSQPNYEGKIHVKRKIISAFKSVADQEMISSVKLQELITKDFHQKHIKADYKEIVSLALELGRDLKASAIKYLDKYVDCYWRISLIEQERQESLKAPKAAPKKEQPRVEPTTTRESTYESPKSRYGVPQPKEPRPTLYSSKYISSAEQQKQINESLIALANDPKHVYDRGLTYDQKAEVREVYGGYNSFVFADTVSDAIEMNQIANEYTQMNKVTKKLPSGIDPRVNDIMKLAINCYNITIHQIENAGGYGKDYETKSNSIRLLQKLNANNSLVIYKQTYEAFMKYYNGLTPENKEALKDHIKKYGYEYKKIFNIPEQYPRIVTVTDIISAINATMSDKISVSFRREDSREIGLEWSEYLVRATKYMTVDEVVALYKRIKREYVESFKNYGENDIEKEVFENEYNRKLELLQDEFIHVIKRKIHFNVEYNKEAPQEEQERAVRLMNVQSAMIANDFFNETLLFNPYSITKEEIRKGEAKRKGELMKEAKAAEDRFFGMSKFKQAMSSAVGSYKKLQALVEKQYVTEQDVAFVKKLF